MRHPREGDYGGACMVDPSRKLRWLPLLGTGLVLAVAGAAGRLRAQEAATHIHLRVPPAPGATAPAPPQPGDSPLPINLPTALCPAHARPLAILPAPPRT